MAKLVFKKEHNNYVGVICIMVLFFIFTALSLSMVMVGADSYKQIKKRTDVTFNSGALISYLQNKIHSYDNGKIDVVDYDNIDVIVLYEDNEKHKTFIYCYKDKLYENLVSTDTEFEAGKGEVLYDVNKILFNKHSENVLKMNVDDNIEYVAVNAGFK